MKKALALSVLAVAFAAPAGAQPVTGMAAMQYYVGTWACVGGPVGPPAQKATATYTLESGVMRSWVNVPPQGKMKTAFAIGGETTYEAKKHRYIGTQVDNGAGWAVSFAKLTGNTERWTDQATNDGKLGHGTAVRTDENTFTYTGYPTLTSTKASFKVTCTKSS